MTLAITKAQPQRTILIDFELCKCSRCRKTATTHRPSEQFDSPRQSKKTEILNKIKFSSANRSQVEVCFYMKRGRMSSGCGPVTTFSPPAGAQSAALSSVPPPQFSLWFQCFNWKILSELHYIDQFISFMGRNKKIDNFFLKFLRGRILSEANILKRKLKLFQKFYGLERTAEKISK